MGRSLRAAAEVDYYFSVSINRANMARYRTARRIEWEPARFRADWDRFENLVITRDGTDVGTLRLLETDDALEVRDLQVLPAHQRQGIGTWVLAQAQAIALARGFHLLRLRVYADNAARHLYRRAGFIEAEQRDGVVHMSLSLERATPLEAPVDTA